MMLPDRILEKDGPSRVDAIASPDARSVVADALPSWTRLRDAGSVPPRGTRTTSGGCVETLAGGRGVSIRCYNCEYRQLCFTNRANVGSISKRDIVPAPN